MRFEMIENFSVTFSSLKFSFCVAAIISAPTPFKRLCNFAPYFSWQKSGQGTTKNFILTLIQRKKSYGLQPKSFLTCPKEKLHPAMRRKFTPSLFQPKKRSGYNRKFYPLNFHGKKQGVWAPKKQRIYRMFKFPRGGLLTKVKQAKDCDILCLPQYIFSKQKQDRVIPFPIILLFYGSNSGVGSYTSIISRAANRNPIVNACNSCLSEISASAFSNCSSRTFCCSVRVALSSVSSRTTVSSNSPLSVPFATLCAVFLRMSVLMQS